MGYRILIQGFPGRTDRGFLGWSTIVLFQTEDGPALLDTGAAGDRPGLLTALKREGLAPEDIRHIWLSHLHFDHTGNVECFSQARVHLHEDELSYFNGPGRYDPAMPVFLVESLLRCPRLELRSDEPELSEGVQMIRTPGHSGGHTSLVLEDAAGCTVFAQDAVKNRVEANGGPVAGAFDLENANASVARIRTRADRILPGHDVPLRKADNGFIPETGQCQRITVTTNNHIHDLVV